MRNVLCCFFALIVLGTSCKREVIPADDVELGKDYFPISTGHSVEYAVDSIIYNDFTKTIDSISYELKDVIGESFIDNEGRTSWIVNRFRRSDSTEVWAELVSYYVTPTSFNLEVIEDNLRFIKLVFPVKPNTNWKGNAYISSNFNPELQWLNNKFWIYRYANLSEPYQTPYSVFPNCVSINQVDITTGDPSNPDEYSDRTYGKEIYAKNVGLVYKELTNWVYQSTVVKFRKGFTLIYRAKKYTP